MIALSLRNGLKRHFSVHRTTADSIGTHIHRRHHRQQSKAYAKFPDKKVKELDFPSVPSIQTPFSSTAPATAGSKIGLVGWYLGMVKSRPIITKSITAAFIYTAADLSSQSLQTITQSSSSDNYDFVRTLRMAGYGMLILGPSLHFWFNFVSRAFPTRDILTTLKKMALGQTVYGPIMTVVFFSVNAALQGESVNEIAARLKRDLLPTMMNGIMYWPFCDFVTFKFVPVHLQPLVSNSFSYLWTVYMTYMASLEKVATT